MARSGLESAGLALETRAHVCIGCNRTGAARGLLGTARRRRVAEVGLGALVLASQRRAGALGAVGAGLAGNARLFAFTGLVLAGLAPVACAFAHDGLDGAGAALGLLSAARWRKVACGGLRAAAGAGEAGGDGVRARRAWQRRRRALCAVRAALASNAHLLTLAGLVLTGRALETRAHACAGSDGAGAA
eukprot:scaffold68483_cov65-Phaeocystis_antarctica.AAC.4